MLNDFIALSNRLGVAQCLYFQSTESWAEYAQRHVPESRVPQRPRRPQPHLDQVRRDGSQP